MNEQAEQALENLLERAISGIDSAVEFSQAQIPDAIEQLLMWKAVEAGLGTSIGVMCAVAVFFILRHHWKTYDDLDLIHSDSFGTAMFLCGLVPASVLLTTVPTLIWLQILVAPKLYLLEYAAELVK